MGMEMELTVEQRRVVDHRGGRLRVVGGAGTGKTTALLARYVALVAGGCRPSSVLVLCRTRAAAGRFRDAVLPHLAGGFDALPVTTFFGLAYDLVNRHDRPITLLTGAEQRRTVARLLADEDPADWPTLGHVLGRPALAAEVAEGLLRLQAGEVGAGAGRIGAGGSRPGAEVGTGEIGGRAGEVGRRAGVGTGEVGSRAGEVGRGAAEDDRLAVAPWPELVVFADRYRQALAVDQRVDASGLLARAAELLVDPDVAAATGARIGQVLVDDYEAATPPMALVLDRLPGTVVVAGDPEGACGGFPGADRRHLDELVTDVHVDLGRHGYRRPGPPVLVTTRHPSLEPEAVAGELLAAHAAGVAWADMAVLVRHPRRRAAAIARALARHGIPARAPVAAVAGDDPVVESVVDMLRWVAGDATALDRLLVSPLSGLDAVEARRIRARARLADAPLEPDPRLVPLVGLRDRVAAAAGTDTPADLAFLVWRLGLAHLVADGADAVLDGLVAFLDALRREADRNPHHRLPDMLAILGDEGVGADPWRVDAAAGAGDAVTVTSILEAAGREWHTVVVAGCVEGELPALGNRHRLFDGATADPTHTPPPADRRRRALAEERRLFALACSRATGRLVATAGPEPGVLLSRFVEGWTPADIRIPDPPGRAPTFRRPTVNPVPIVTDAGLALSATQLDTYDDCPLRYAYRYVLRVRDEGGVRADLGTLVHEVLARFLDPATAGDRPRTRETLLAMAEEMWRHDIARYRPQVDEARRDFLAMLETWWQFEGQGQLAPDVLDVERGFAIEVGDPGAGVRLRGSIDRVDRVERPGGGHGIRIVDYKTGKKEPRPGETDGNIQLAVYHLAATRDPALAAAGPVTELRLLFLRTMHAFDQEVTAGHAEATEKRILDVAHHIRAEEFAPSVDATCRWCEFQRLCPIQPEGREVESSWP
jgi:superfamily I DNA/RNA helicase/RecB family exonuclease